MSMSLRILAFALGLTLLAGCGEPPDPRLREPLVLLHGPALERLLERLARLEGTPLARNAKSLRGRLGGCATVWGTPRAGGRDAAQQALADLRCLTAEDEDDERLTLARRRRGDAAGWIQWPLGGNGRLELGLELLDEDLALTGRVEPPAIPGALALLLPGQSPPAAPAIEPTRAVIHLRVKPADGLPLSQWIPTGGQADRLFALKGRLLAGALLEGTWELAFVTPETPGSLPLPVAALHHRLEDPIRRAVDEALDQLERTWPIRRTPRRFGLDPDADPSAAARPDTGVDGGCYLDLPLLPELAPCWAITPEALLIGYRPEAVERALAAPDVSAAAAVGSGPDSVVSGPRAAATGLDVDFDRLRAIDRALAPEAEGPRPADLWSKLALRWREERDGTISLDARLKARP